MSVNIFNCVIVLVNVYFLFISAERLQDTNIYHEDLDWGNKFGREYKSEATKPLYNFYSREKSTHVPQEKGRFFYDTRADDRSGYGGSGGCYCPREDSGFPIALGLGAIAAGLVISALLSMQMMMGGAAAAGGRRRKRDANDGPSETDYQNNWFHNLANGLFKYE